MERAKKFQQTGNWEKARIEFKNVLQIEPRNVEAGFLLGQVLEQLQDWQQAGTQYVRVLRVDPSHVDAKMRLGWLYLRGNAGAFDRAEELAMEVLVENSNSTDAF